jgi:hypothetical protein
VRRIGAVGVAQQVVGIHQVQRAPPGRSQLFPLSEHVTAGVVAASVCVVHGTAFRQAQCERRVREAGEALATMAVGTETINEVGTTAERRGRVTA